MKTRQEITSHILEVDVFTNYYYMIPPKFNLWKKFILAISRLLKCRWYCTNSPLSRGISCTVPPHHVWDHAASSPVWISHYTSLWPIWEKNSRTWSPWSMTGRNSHSDGVNLSGFVDLTSIKNLCNILPCFPCVDFFLNPLLFLVRNSV